MNHIPKPLFPVIFAGALAMAGAAGAENKTVSISGSLSAGVGSGGSFATISTSTGGGSASCSNGVCTAGFSGSVSSGSFARPSGGNLGGNGITVVTPLVLQPTPVIAPPSSAICDFLAGSRFSSFAARFGCDGTD